MKKRFLITSLALTIAVSTMSGCGINTSLTVREADVATVATEVCDNSSTGTSAEYSDEVREDVEVGYDEGCDESYDIETLEEVVNASEEDVAFSFSEDRSSTLSETKGFMVEEPFVSPDRRDFNTEEYSTIKESGFKDVSISPLSTFSADVDTASYSNIRRMIIDGLGKNDIPSGAVRIEEMINYFDYDYARPRKGEPFSVNAQISKCPWNEDNLLMMLGLQTEKIDFEDAKDSNLVFLIDVSGSMYDDDKLPLLKKAFGMLIDNLSEKDRVSIVTYAGTDEVLIKGVPASNKKKIMDTLDCLEAAGSTNGGQGIISAYKLAEKYYIEGGNNRVLLATDGDFNVGLSSQADLYDLIDSKKDKGIFLSVLGFGMGNISDTNMETLADAGNGNYAYIDNLKEAKKVLVKELGATMVTVAKDVKFQVEFNPAVVKEYRLIGYENRALANEDFDNDKKDAGEIGAGHSVTVLYEIALNDGDSNEKELKYQDSHISNKEKYANEFLTVSIRYKEPNEDKSKLLEYPIGEEAYSSRPTDDFLFASAVAEFGMILRDSEYIGDGSLRQVSRILNDIELDDEYKEEFRELVEYVRY